MTKDEGQDTPTEQVNLANAVHLSDSEDEEEIEDITNDFTLPEDEIATVRSFFSSPLSNPDTSSACIRIHSPDKNIYISFNSLFHFQHSNPNNHLSLYPQQKPQTFHPLLLLKKYHSQKILNHPLLHLHPSLLRLQEKRVDHKRNKKWMSKTRTRVVDKKKKKKLK